MSHILSYRDLERKTHELEQEALMRRQADDVLRKSEERYRMFFNYSPLGIVHFDCDGLIIDCNERFLEIMGAPREKLIGFNMPASLRDEKMRAAVIAGLSGEANYFEGDYLSLSGNKLTPVRALYSRVNSEDGRFLGAVGLLEDITAQKQTEEALRESREFLGKIINSISYPIFVKDRQHRLILVNDAECTLAGTTREALLGKTDYDFFPKEQVDVFWEKDEAVFESGEENENEEQITDGRGLNRTIITKKTLYTDKAQNKFIVGVIRDITERKEAQLALQAAHQELQDIIEFLPDATLVVDREKKVIYWNRAMEEMTGVEKSSILGKSDFAYAVPFYGKKRAMLIDLVMAEELEIEDKYDFVKRIGKTVYGEAFVPGAYQGKGAYLWATAAPLIGRDGSIIGFIQSIRDVSDRKHAEEAVRQSEEKYRQLFETVSDAILVFDGETGRFIDVNERALHLYGYSRDEFLGLKHNDITAQPDQSAASIKETLVGIRTQVPLRYHRKKDGTQFPAEISSSTFVLSGRRALCGVVRDITERRRVEEELSSYHDHLEDLIKERTAELARANEQLTLEIEERKRAEEALKFFAYSVAHDLKSPAIGIYGLTKRLYKLSRDVLDEKCRSYCDQIMKVSEHIAALVEKINLYIVTKETRLSFEKTTIKEILGMLKDEFSVQFSIRRIDWIIPDCEVEITADRLSLLRVFRNLVDNALKHGGEQLSKIWIGYEERIDCHVFTIADNGRGLKGADSKKIFGIFQRHETSRGVEGAGLGLTIVKEIAEKHGGKAWVEQTAKKGATFFISVSKNLPLS
ncbi:MAG: PAS domain S-box protein [Syntrophobacteraceae bacterium]